MCSADYPLNRITSGEQLRVPILDKSGDAAGDVSLYVNTGGYQSKPLAKCQPYTCIYLVATVLLRCTPIMLLTIATSDVLCWTAGSGTGSRSGATTGQLTLLV